MQKEFFTEDIAFMVLGPEHADDDYKAVQGNIELIQKVRGERNGWPDTTMTYEENKKDLEWHQDEFENGKSFAYVVYTRDKNIYLGCVYVYPKEKGYIQIPEGYDVDINFWVTKEALEMGLFDEISSLITSEIAQNNPFGKPYFSNRVMHSRDII